MSATTESRMGPIAPTLEGVSCCPPLFNLGIDVRTADVAKLMARLKRLTTTASVGDGGAYWEDPSYSQIHLTTTLSEEEIDDWLWAAEHGCDYVGVFKRD